MRQLLTFVFQSPGPRIFVADNFFKFYNIPSCFTPLYILQLQNHLHRNQIRNFSEVKNGKPKSSDIDTNAIRKILSQRKARRQKIQEAIVLHQKKLKTNVEDAILDRKIKLQATEKKIRAKGKMIMEDIRNTKDKMKEKMEEIIERENIYTIPNLLCVARIVFSPFLGYLIVTNCFEYALAFMAVAGFSDWVDGWVARNYKSQSTKIGSFLDPMADKVLIGTLFLSLTYINLIPVPLTVLIVAKDVILIAAGFVIRYQSLPPPRTFARYFDATHATAQLAPTFISKVNTGIQLALVGSTLAAPIFGYVNHFGLQALWYVTAASTVLAAGSYIYSKKTYKILKDKEKKDNKN